MTAAQNPPPTESVDRDFVISCSFDASREVIFK